MDLCVSHLPSIADDEGAKLVKLRHSPTNTDHGIVRHSRLTIGCISDRPLHEPPLSMSLHHHGTLPDFSQSASATYILSIQAFDWATGTQASSNGTSTCKIKLLASHEARAVKDVT